jgi:hypothetical protein
VTVTRFLTEPVVIHPRIDGAEDDWGNATEGWGPNRHTKGRFEQRSGEERTTNADTQISDWRLFLEPSVVIHGRDRVSDRYGRVFEVVGPATMHSTPARAVYVEASLRHVEGG